MRQYCFKNRLITITAVILTLFTLQSTQAQVNCDSLKKVFINGYYVVNSKCGLAQGEINLQMNSDPSNYSYSWIPNVSSTNTADSLSAGFYRVLIHPNVFPDCVLDTVFFVSNSNGPAFDVQKELATCKAKDGKITLIPANPNAQLSFQWPNGSTNSFLSQIDSGLYTVRVTDQASGCFSIESILLSNKNPLVSTPQVINYPKCGKPIGKIEINVANGSGNYLYNGNPSATYQNLAAGNYTFLISDQQTQCRDTVYLNLTDLSVEGSVGLIPHSIPCPSNAQKTGNSPRSKGFVEIQVQPGANFRMPFTYNIINGSGNTFQPDTLPKGVYELQVNDADGCNLPIKSFIIDAPDNFDQSPLPDLKPETAQELGSITLYLKGGTSPYRLDWNDIPGDDNPIDRVNLNAGLYGARVYDAADCSFIIGPYTIPAENPKTDIVHLFVKKGTTQSFCPTLPTGVVVATNGNNGNNDVTYFLTNGASFGTFSGLGSWILHTSDGCLDFTASPTAALGLIPDTFKIRRFVDPTSVLDLTYYVLVTITDDTTSFENVYFTVSAGQSGTFCGTIPAGISNFEVVQAGINGLNGPLGQYGTYQIDSSACIHFQASDVTGYNVGKICVGAYSPSTHRSHIICYWPSIQQPGGCQGDLIPFDTLHLTIDSCTMPAQLCVDIPYDQIKEYSILDNGTDFSNTLISPCGPDTLRSYASTQWPYIGPYVLNNWQIGTNQYSGTFQNIQDLVLLMNQLDPGGSWTLQNDQIILGGNQTKSYGPISISNVLGSSLVLTPEYKIRNLQTALSLGTGIHALQFNQKEKACSDSVLVTVTCTGCPTFHNYQPDSLGVIIVTADTCNGEFPFCTTILNKINIINQYDISVDNVYNPTLSACGTLLALPLDTGLHVISIREKATNCINNLKVKVNCPPPGIGDLMANPDNFISPLATEIELPILNNDVIFGVLGNKAGLFSVQTIVAPKLGGVTYFPNEGIFKYFPENGCGQDTFTYALRDTIGRESITQVAVKVYCDKLFVFNGISPNGDQLNDVWHIIGIESFSDNEVSVYNRWGALVFKQRGYNNQSAWDGQSNGKDLPDGTYFYIIDLGNGETSVKGYLQIMH